MTKKLCQRCKKRYWDKEGLEANYPALSRRTNKKYTDICSQCGQEEAMNDLKRYLGGR